MTRNHALILALGSALALAFCGSALAQVTPHVLRMPVDGVEAPLTPAQKAKNAWTKFFQDHGVAVPDPWSAGFNLSRRGLTSIPSQPYPASVVTGTIDLSSNKLANVDGLSSLTSVGGNLFLSTNELTTIDALSHLTSVGGDLSLYSNKLTNVDALANVTRVGQYVFLFNNRLTNVNGLANLTSVGGGMELNNNPLTDIKGLAGLTSLGSPLLVVLVGTAGVRIPASAWVCQPAQADMVGLSGSYFYLTQAQACQ